MMYVRVVRVAVKPPGVPVTVAVRQASRHWLSMFVHVMFVVDMRMFVLNLRMQVLVFMTLGQVQPNADSHQSSRSYKVHGHRIV